MNRKQLSLPGRQPIETAAIAPDEIRAKRSGRDAVPLIVNRSWPGVRNGQHVTVPEQRARRLIKGGFASEVKP